MGVLSASVVAPVVVIVPGGVYRAGGSQPLIAGLIGEKLVGGSHRGRVIGVGIHIVAGKQEQVGACGEDSVPHRL
jgi:hypothetical protein